MGWHEYVFLGMCEFLENDDDVVQCLLGIADKYHIDTKNLEIDDPDDILPIINDFLKKKYEIDMNVMHSNYHGLCSYVAIGYDIENFKSDKLFSEYMISATNKLKDIYKYLELDDEPKIVTSCCK